MRIYWRYLILLVLALGWFPIRAAATSGLPNSAEFGYGARIDIWGQNVLASVDLASNLGLDWIGVEFNWARMWADASNPPDLAMLNQVIERAKLYNLSVVLSITGIPAWANTAQGPDPNITSSLLVNLIRIYSGTLQAVELFPGANTAQGWNASPNPEDYRSLLETVNASVKAAGFEIYVLTTVFPVDAGGASGDMEAGQFIEYFYQAGAAHLLPVIGIRFDAMLGDPMTVPASGEKHYLRYYEEIRSLMLNNNHPEGLIWITGFCWPSAYQAHLPSEAAMPETYEGQAQWLNQAFTLLKGQLYIGAGLFYWLNPPAAEQPNQNSLFLSDGSLHPGSAQLQNLINEANPSSSAMAAPNSSPTSAPADVLASNPSQAVDSLVLVKYSTKTDLKHAQP